MTAPEPRVIATVDPTAKVLARRPLRKDVDERTLSHFGDELWNLTPGVFEPHKRALTITFGNCPEGFQVVARTYLWTLINTDDPQGMARANVSRLSLRSILAAAKPLFAFLHFLDDRDVHDLRAVSPEDFDAYLEVVRALGVQSSRKEDYLAEVYRLWSYRSQLPPTAQLPDALPWDGDKASILIGRRPPQVENLTPRIAEDTMDALLLWSLRYVRDFADEIVAANSSRMALRQTIRSLRRVAGERTPSDRVSYQLVRDVRAWIGSLQATGAGLPGKRDADGTLSVNWTQIRRILNCGGGAFNPGTVVRALVERSNLPIQDGHVLAVPNTSMLDGRTWLDEPIRYEDAHRHAARLLTACFVVVIYLSGMRAGEGLSLRVGCAEHDPATDLRLVRGTVWKGAQDDAGNKIAEGQDRKDPWVVVAPVHEAIAVLERLHDSKYLFPTQIDPDGRGRYVDDNPDRNSLSTQTINLLIRDFIDDINAYCHANGRTDSIPADPAGAITGSRLRRTLAWHIYRRPRGLVAGAIQYGHVRTQMFLGYAGSYDSGFRDVAGMEDLLLRLENLERNAHALLDGEAVSGPAAGEYERRVHAAHDTFAGRVLRTMQSSRSMLANPDLQVFPGKGVTCVFDARQALCELTRERSGPAAPALSDCRTACRNIARTDRDIAGIEAEAADLRVRVADQLSPPIRHQRERERLAELDHTMSMHSNQRPRRGPR